VIACSVQRSQLLCCSARRSSISRLPAESRFQQPSRRFRRNLSARPAAIRPFRRHGEAGEVLAPEGADCERVLRRSPKRVSTSTRGLANFKRGVTAFAASWSDSMACIDPRTIMRKEG
jgi:hypothetical protein